MIISEKQIMQLMSITRRYKDVCLQMNWNDHLAECNQLLRQIINQQSEELKDIK